MKHKVTAVIVSIAMILCNCGYAFAEEGGIEQGVFSEEISSDERVEPYADEDSEYSVSCAEMGEDISYEGNVSLKVEYECDTECYVYGEILEESGNPHITKNYVKSEPGEDCQSIEFFERDMPEYYTIKAYLVDIETGEVISNVYENPLHTKAFVKLDERAWDEAPWERKVNLSNGNYGVFAEDTVIVYGNSYVNTWNEADSASGIYTFHNIDEQMDGVRSGCNLAYYYDEELKLVAKAAAVTKSGTESVTVTTVQPVLEEVFDYLKIDFNAQDETVTVDMSDMPEGVSYNSGYYEDESEAYGEEASYAARAAAYAEEPAICRANPDAAEIRTTLGVSQDYTFDMLKKGEATLSGRVGVKMDFPMKLYITESKQFFQFDINASLSGNFNLEGKADMEVPLCIYFIPVIQGIMYLRVRPTMLLSAGGSISFGVVSKGEISTRTDPEKGFQILSRRFDASELEVEAAGSVFCGVELSPALIFFPSMRILEASFRMGPEITASMSSPIPVEEQKEGDHTCQRCITGVGNICAELETDITAFKQPFKSKKKFSLTGFEFYYSIDHSQGGRGICPFGRLEEDDGEEDDGEYVEKYHYKYPEGGDTWSGHIRAEDGVVYDVSVSNKNQYAIIRGWVKESTHDTPTSFTIPSSFSKTQIEYCNKGVVEDMEESGFFEDNYRVLGASIDSSEFRSGEVTFENGIEKIFIKGYTFYPSSLNLPGSLKDFEIEDWYETDEPIDLVIPSGTRRVSLYQCSGVENVSLPDSVEVLEMTGCKNLKSVNVPGGIKKIGRGMFENCSSLETISLQGGITAIGEDAFMHCESLKSVTIPSSVTSIEQGAFCSCSSLKSVTIPNGVTSIEPTVFYYCSSLESVTIPSSVTSIGEYAFSGCGLKSVTIPSSVTSIGKYAFSGCGLESVTIPSSVTSIEPYLFAYCSSLENITIPNGIKYIGERAFESCSSLENITIPNGTKYIGDFAFTQCSSLKKVNIQEGLITIGKYAFFYCESLEEINFPDSLQYIKNCAFEGCSGIRDISFPDSLRYIDDWAFRGCSGLTHLTIPDNAKHIDRGAFDDLNLKSIEVGAAIAYLPYLRVENLIVKEGVTTISSDFECIRSNSLLTVTLPESVTFIKSYAFSSCSNLTDIYIPGTSVEFGDYFGDYVFTNTENLTIHGVSGSPTEDYARRRNIRFAAINAPVTPGGSENTNPSVTPGGSENTNPSVTPGGSGSTDPSVTPGGSGSTNPSVTPGTKKIPQTISVKVKAKSYKASSLKKKAKTFKIKASAKTKLTYTSSNKKYVRVSASGKVTVKKGTPKGVYKITVKAAAKNGYKKARKVIKIKVK